MPTPIQKTYRVTCACDKQHVFDITVEVKQPPATNKQPPKTFTVQKYCPFCNNMINIDIPDEPAETGFVTRE